MLEYKFYAEMNKLRKFGYKINESPDGWGWRFHLDGGEYNIALDNEHECVEITKEKSLDIRLPYQVWKGVDITVNGEGCGIIFTYKADGALVNGTIELR